MCAGRIGDTAVRICPSAKIRTISTEVAIWVCPPRDEFAKHEAMLAANVARFLGLNL
jgi:hypothetical protein